MHVFTVTVYWALAHSFLMGRAALDNGTCGHECMSLLLLCTGLRLIPFFSGVNCIVEDLVSIGLWLRFGTRLLLDGYEHL